MAGHGPWICWSDNRTLDLLVRKPHFGLVGHGRPWLFMNSSTRVDLLHTQPSGQFLTNCPGLFLRPMYWIYPINKSGPSDVMDPLDVWELLDVLDLLD